MISILVALFRARFGLLRQTARDRGSFSMEALIIAAGLAVVGGIAAAVILSKVNEKKSSIK